MDIFGLLCEVLFPFYIKNKGGKSQKREQNFQLCLKAPGKPVSNPPILLEIKLPGEQKSQNGAKTPNHSKQTACKQHASLSAAAASQLRKAK